MFRIILLCLSLMMFINHDTFAQQDHAKTDSSRVYRNIETYSKKSKFTKFIYGLVFKPVTKESQKPNKKVRKKIQRPYSVFEGKIIRSIDIVTLDPFGYSVTDTSILPQNYLTKIGNKSHIATQHIAIRNLLLFKRNDPFDSLLVRESERLIRTQNYVHEVSFYIVSAGGNSDSVDIFIREMDIWSIIPDGSISASGFNVKLTDKNFLGFGHEFQNSFARNFRSGINTFNTNYSIPNIRNTYISSTLHYGIDGYHNLNRSLSVDRPFFSPFAKWAAGISLASQIKKDSLKYMGLTYVPFNLKFNTQDYWAGLSHGIFKGNTEEERVTNLIVTLRYFRARFFEKPSELYDPLHIYSSEDFYLTGIGISTRTYVQDKYIFDYGITEDIPVGKVYGLTAGYQLKNNAGRTYLGLRFAFGNLHDWGYLSSNFEYGTFVRDSHLEQSVISAGLNYFTDLIEVGNWKFRQFVKPQIMLGINRFPSENININNTNGVLGFSSGSLIGTKKIVLTLQTQSYSPWHILGFHFGPYLIYSMGMLGDASKGFEKSRIYSQFSLGVLIKNEYLVFDVFQISIAFYPIIPDDGTNIIKINSNSTTDFGFNDFVIGKPATVAFQ